MMATRLWLLSALMLLLYVVPVPGQVAGGRGGAGGAGGLGGPGGNGGNGGSNGGQGGQGGWGGPVSRGSDAECRHIGHHQCPGHLQHARMLPNPHDCGSFCSCAGGRGRYSPCPGGLHFSPRLQVCTWPWDAGCNRSVTYK